MVQFFFAGVENNAGKGENAGYRKFLIFPTTFSIVFFLWLLKVGTVRQNLNLFSTRGESRQKQAQEKQSGLFIMEPYPRKRGLNPLPHNPDF